MADDKKGQDVVQKLCRFTPDLAAKIEAYQKALGLRSFQNAVEVICGQYLADKPKDEEKKPS